jgi:hypothetical protein
MRSKWRSAALIFRYKTSLITIFSCQTLSKVALLPAEARGKVGKEHQAHHAKLCQNDRILAVNEFPSEHGFDAGHIRSIIEHEQVNIPAKNTSQSRDKAIQEEFAINPSRSLIQKESEVDIASCAVPALHHGPEKEDGDDTVFLYEKRVYSSTDFSHLFHWFLSRSR